MVFGGPSTYEFSRVGDHLSSPSGPKRALARPSFLLFWEPAEGFGSLYLYVSMYCFLTCLGYIILGARGGRLSLWTRAV